MNILKSFLFAAAALVAPIVMTHPAQAITVTSFTNDISAFPTTSDGYQAPSGGTATVDAAVGSIGGQYRTPWEGEGAIYEALAYTSVRDGAAIYNLSGTVLSLFWGSVDSYNTLTFWTGADATGSSVTFDTALLGSPTALGHHLVTLFTSEVFNSVVLASTSPAFEFANMQATPIPPALVLFASGLGALGWLRRRRVVAA